LGQVALLLLVETGCGGGAHNARPNAAPRYTTKALHAETSHSP
jgi:hypothetical protein